MIRARRLVAKILNKNRIMGVVRYVVILALALIAFAIVLLLAGKDPWQAYEDVFTFTLNNSYGRSEVVARMIPLLLTAVAVALPARLGLINVGGEGQFYMGAWLATWGALTFTTLPQNALLPLMVVLGLIGGGVWAAIPAIMRAKGWLTKPSLPCC